MQGTFVMTGPGMPKRPSSGVSARQDVIASLCSGGLKYLSSNNQTGNVIENKGAAVSHNPLRRRLALLNMTESAFAHTLGGCFRVKVPVLDLTALRRRRLVLGQDAMLSQACRSAKREDIKIERTKPISN